ncbi:DUF1501 domain-containing protein [Lewinella sp. W8]|uniref:DUF1501 domain-containing protein n=1 Tax=Lewinella sp. W8 TaxID=2528208 RepID=UPI0010684848|nr:DUF1501 domain-containing protein [Lewinella sp. W8]MTB52754.1 DUF1501 domain-containing protein [Lewinella sp. W8]
MKRRSFLRKASLLPLPLILNQFKLSALSQPFLAGEMNDDDRVLVLLQLNGGNDGLNTLIPLDQYDNLAAVRSNIIIPQGDLLQVEDTAAFHPAMSGIRSLYDEGKVAVLQGVGYPQQNRSHFRSTDIWNTASDADTVLTTGWLGRHLDARYPGFPGDYPSVEEPSPFAIVMGNSVSETCQGTSGNFSIAIADIDNVGQLPSFDGGADLNTPYGRELDWLRITIAQSNEYATGISEAAEMGNTMVPYPENNEVAAKLQSVARLISGGLRTKVYIVELGGFDTHADQSVAGETGTGVHANLLRTLSEAVAAFQADLQALGLEERVLGMTFSEFGRRIRSNASQGTDHGDAAPLFLFGSCVSGGITGESPEIDPAVGVQEGVAMQYDFRNVYGSVLMDWFGVSEEAVGELLLDDFSYVPVLAACNATTSIGARPQVQSPDLTAAPNPFRESFTVSFVTGNERARLALFNAMGQQLRVVSDRSFSAGAHQLNVETHGLPAGAYYIHLTLSGGRRITRRVVKQ